MNDKKNEFNEFKKNFKVKPIPNDFKTLYKVFKYFEKNKGEYLTYRKISESLNVKLSTTKTLVNHLINNGLISKKFKMGRSPVFLSKCDFENKCEFIWGRKDISYICETEKNHLLLTINQYNIDDIEFTAKVKELKETNIDSRNFFSIYNLVCDRLMELGIDNIYKLELRSIAHRFKMGN